MGVQQGFNRFQPVNPQFNPYPTTTPQHQVYPNLPHNNTMPNFQHNNNQYPPQYPQHPVPSVQNNNIPSFGNQQPETGGFPAPYPTSNFQQQHASAPPPSFVPQNTPYTNPHLYANNMPSNAPYNANMRSNAPYPNMPSNTP